jgi:hypothetical protein
VIKSRRIELAGHIASMGEHRGAYRVWVRKPEERKCLEELGLGGGII